MEKYDLTYFKFLGGLMADEDTGREHHGGSSVSTHQSDEWGVETEFPLAPPRSKEEESIPGNHILFSSIVTSQTNKRTSLKAVVGGTVGDIKSRLEKGARRMSGVFGGAATTTEKPKEHHVVKHHDIPSKGSFKQDAHPPAKTTHTPFGFQGLPKHHDDEHEVRRPKKGPPPPMHAMTLAKGVNSGLAPKHMTKGIEVEY